MRFTFKTHIPKIANAPTVCRRLNSNRCTNSRRTCLNPAHPLMNSNSTKIGTFNPFSAVFCLLPHYLCTFTVAFLQHDVIRMISLNYHIIHLTFFRKQRAKLNKNAECTSPGLNISETDTNDDRLLLQTAMTGSIGFTLSIHPFARFIPLNISRNMLLFDSSIHLDWWTNNKGNMFWHKGTFVIFSSKVLVGLGSSISKPLMSQFLTNWPRSWSPCGFIKTGSWQRSKKS